MESGFMEDVEVIAQDFDPIGDDPKRKIAVAAAAVIIALLSFFVVAGAASSVDSHSATIESLDQKKGTVMGLVAASTAASAAVSLLAGDAGTPIAEKLVDLSSDFLIVITAIYLEKYLLTTLGFAAFKILVPLSCVLIAAAVFIRKRPLQQAFVRLSAKLALFGFAIFLVVPVSVGVSNMIEATYEDSINETIALADQTAESIEASAASAPAAEEAGDSASASPLEWLANIPNNVTNTVTETVSGLTDDAQKALNGFIEALAVMIVTSCVIPLLVLVFFLWLVKLILGIDVAAPAQMLRPRSLGRGIGRG